MFFFLTIYDQIGGKIRVLLLSVTNLGMNVEGGTPGTPPHLEPSMYILVGQ